MKSIYLRPIRRGEYDLANISLIGHDPVTGRSFEDCNAEWTAALDHVKEREAATRPWRIIRRLRIRWQTISLQTHLGLPG